jgi:aspartate-semialdehyde dehydrogenase
MRSTPHLRVGILGATGAVGQRFVQLLAEHPWFEITALAASERSAGQSYREAVNWIGDAALPESVAEMEVQLTDTALDCDFVFSGLSSSVAGSVEKAFAEAGYPVISNAKNYRMDPTVPLLIPEVNPDHAALVETQQWGNGGFIVTNPNCSTVGLVCALHPIREAFGLEQVEVTTLQALSGAGHPGVPSLDALGNVIPYIGGEEEKMATEPTKLWGTLADGTITPAELRVSAQCTRVPVLDGHLESISVGLTETASPSDVHAVLEEYESPLKGLDLPSAPDPFICVTDAEDGPQPRRDVNEGGGMKVTVGRIRPCTVLDIRLVALVHNTIRGAAGGAILNAELLAKQDYLKPQRSASAVATK